MYIGGGMGAKLALYPIAPGSTAGTRLTNWAIVIRVADGDITPPPAESTNRTARRWRIFFIGGGTKNYG